MNADKKYKQFTCHRRKFLIEKAYYWIITYTATGMPLDAYTYESLNDCKKRIDAFNKATDDAFKILGW
jgi:hypothetical protein